MNEVKNESLPTSISCGFESYLTRKWYQKHITSVGSDVKARRPNRDISLETGTAHKSVVVPYKNMNSLVLLTTVNDK